MSRYPSALWKPIRDTSTVRVTKDILCFHTCVGSMRGTRAYFDRLDIQVYSHGIIGGIWGGDAGYNLDGVAWQIADTNYRAAANLNGNYRVISWETADNATRPIAPWTPKQGNKIVQVCVDAHDRDGIPLVMIPDSKPGRRGVGYHRLGCDPYRVSGGELWSSAYGKDCPTDPRIRQLPGLVQRARDIVNGTIPAPKPPEEDMDAAQFKELTDYIHDTTWAAVRAGLTGTENSRYRYEDTGKDLAAISVAGQTRKVLDAVKALTPTPPPAG